MRISAGAPYPLGATFDGQGTNFAVFSAHAEKMELCLFDRDGVRELERILLPERSGDVWHGYLKDAVLGQRYGYRAYGPYDPENGFRFNANKLLLDPYAKEISGRLILNETHFGYRLGDARADLSFDPRDNADSMVKGVVTDGLDEIASTRPRIPWEDTTIYEAHVKGLTQLRGDVPPSWRGTFRALASPAIINHLKRLGVTAIELLPVHAFIDDWFVSQRGLKNYWGYNTLGFFAPDSRYLGGGNLEDFRSTVARLHDAGIEVILDVVYNHSCEGDHLGPTLSFRGLDNASYYRLQPSQPRFYENPTGCGNALNLSHPHVRQMVIESLRYWAETFDIDGFRFDLAATLARNDSGFDPDAPFFAAIRADPVLSHVKLIAEPWDLGANGYRIGAFPREWSEWNDHFRRTLRRFWHGEGNLLGDMGRRMAGSAELFGRPGRTPRASINFVTAHDGFTLADLVSYRHKHNEKNLEDNRDGETHNDSSNCGAEGPSSDPEIVAARRNLRKNLLASLFLARGVPMILAGDEAGNSQDGNNNAYCQDNENGWVKWTELGGHEDLTDFIGQLAALRRRFPQLRSKRWLEGRREGGSHDVLWLTPEGKEMTAEDWDFPNGRFLSYLLGPELEDEAPLFIVLNAAPEPIVFKLPDLPDSGSWTAALDTAGEAASAAFDSGSMHQAPARSVLVFSGPP